MAKQKDSRSEVAQAPPPQGVEEASTFQPALPRYRVELNCPTPILHRSLEVEAAGEDAAKAEFCKANNISGSNHPWKITRLT